MQANLRCTLTREIEIKSSGSHFHEIFACRPHHLSKICPSDVQGCVLQDGEFGKNGSTIVWSFTQNGKACIGKDIIENVDMDKKTITYRVVDGEFLKHYKSFLLHLHVVPKAANVSTVKWTFEYEKLREDVPDPIGFAELILKLTNETAKHLNA